MKQDPNRIAAFESIAMAHLDAAFNLARWITRDAAMAEDVVQDAMVRALTYFAGFRGENARAWLLQIVRNVALSKLDTQRAAPLSFDSMMNDAAGDLQFDGLIAADDDPETLLQRQQDRKQIHRMLAALPVELRECLVLRELEELSYKEIARVIDAPIGTVMSRLWRARQLLSQQVGSGTADKFKTQVGESL